MRAIRFAKTGGPEVLTLENIDLPAPKPGQVRIRHTAIGVNFIDTYHRSGLYPASLPSGLGLEAAGVVDALGEDATSLKVGDRVAYCSGPIGAYADANNVPADRVVKLPADISDDAAAASLLKGLTVQYLLKHTFPVKAGQTIVFHSAAGGVGLIACQWANHLGCTVIGTVGHAEKIALAKANGCAHVLNTRSDDWVKQVRELTKGQGVPVVYDSIGKDTFEGSLDCLDVRGMMVSFGNSSGAVPPFQPGDPERQRFALHHASDARALHTRRQRASGNGRRPLFGDRIRGGEDHYRSALQAGRCARRARGPALP